MEYLVKTDFNQIIRTDILDNLTESDDRKLDTEELTAMATVKSYLGNRFDLTAEYALTGTDRDPKLIRTLTQLIIFELYKSRATADLPDHIWKGEKQAMDWLKGVRDGLLSTDLTPVDEDGDRFAIRTSPATQKYSRRF